MKSKKSEIPDGVGLLISDVVDQLQRKGYSITAQQIRQYEERDGLITSIRTKGNYREYLSSTIDTIVFIRRLEIARYSKKRIKDFFVLTDSILKHPGIKTTQQFDQKVGIAFFIAKLSAEIERGSTEYIKIQALVNRYCDFCNEIKYKFELVKQIMDEGMREIEVKKTTMAGIIK